MERRKGSEDDNCARLLKSIKAEHCKSRSVSSAAISARDQRLNRGPIRRKGIEVSPSFLSIGPCSGRM
jgi:hypothetical protein